MKASPQNILVKLFIATFFCLAGGIASANTLLCLKKEISDDGANWKDANTELEAVSINGVAHFRFTAYSCNPEEFGGVQGIELFDEQLSISNQVMGDLLPATIDEMNNPIVEPLIWTTAIADYCGDYEGSIENIAKAEGFSMKNGDKRVGVDNAWALCEPPVVVGGEGCTPGYWRQWHHLDNWPAPAFQRFSQVFGRSITIRLGRRIVVEDPILFMAVRARGGDVNALARHTVAAYLNALSNDVDYDLNANQVIADFQQAFDSQSYETTKNVFADFNEQGCPL